MGAGWGGEDLPRRPTLLSAHAASDRLSRGSAVLGCENNRRGLDRLGTRLGAVPVGTGPARPVGGRGAGGPNPPGFRILQNRNGLRYVQNSRVHTPTPLR